MAKTKRPHLISTLFPQFIKCPHNYLWSLITTVQSWSPGLFLISRFISWKVPISWSVTTIITFIVHFLRNSRESPKSMTDWFMFTKSGICSFLLTNVAAWECLATGTSYWGQLTPTLWGLGFLRQPVKLHQSAHSSPHQSSYLCVCVCPFLILSWPLLKVPGAKPHKMCQGCVSSIWLVLVQSPPRYTEACTYNLWSALSILHLLSNALAVMNYLFWFPN